MKTTERSIVLIVLLFFLPYSIPLLAQRLIPSTSMNEKRIFHELQVMPDGKVLVFGGQTSDAMFRPVYHASSEIYDPVTSTWTATGNLNIGRAKFCSVVTKQGMVLAIGGETVDGSTASVESYDPETGIWTNIGTLGKLRKKLDAVVMDDGSILVVGGDDNSFETADATGSSWELHDFPGMEYRIPESPSVIELSDGRALVVGSQPGPYPNWAVLISPKVFTIETTAKPTVEDHPNAGLALLKNGNVLVTGGTATGINEIFDPATNEFVSTGSFNKPHLASQLIPMTNGSIAAVDIGNTFSDIILEVYDPTTASWSFRTGHDFTALSYYKRVLLGDGQWLICGGMEYLGSMATGSSKCFIFKESDK